MDLSNGKAKVLDAIDRTSSLFSNDCIGNKMASAVLPSALILKEILPVAMGAESSPFSREKVAFVPTPVMLAESPLKSCKGSSGIIFKITFES